MTPVLRIEACAPGATIQDGGRLHLRRLGIATAGAMDGLALAVANLLVGNPPATAAVELTLAGARLRVEGGPVLLAAAGPGVVLRIAGRALPPGLSGRAEAGDAVEISAPQGGVHGYLAVAGGLALRPVMGSLSTHLRSGIGPEMLAPGQRLPLHPGPPPAPRRIDRLPPASDGPIRIMAGPQEDAFAPGALAALTGTDWRIGARSDRMGRFLDGPPIPPLPGSMVSDGIVAGGIQCPPSGQPIVLMRDCQTTGGYPRLATVISADLDRLAQIPPGGLLRLRLVDRATAIAAARQRAAQVAGLQVLPAGGPDTARLMSANLVSGVVDARAPDSPA